MTSLSLAGNAFFCYPACLKSILDSGSISTFSACPDPLCSFIASTTVASVHNEWACTTDGVPIGDPLIWEGITANDTEIVGIDFSSCGGGLAGMWLVFVVLLI